MGNTVHLQIMDVGGFFPSPTPWSWTFSTGRCSPWTKGFFRSWPFWGGEWRDLFRGENVTSVLGDQKVTNGRSWHGICTYIYHKFKPIVGKYSIYGAYGKHRVKPPPKYQHIHLGMWKFHLPMAQMKIYRRKTMAGFCPRNPLVNM